MFIDSPAFYFATIRKITASFGSLFNNLYIQRFDEPGGKGNSLRRVQVPLEYAATQKWWRKRMRDVAAQGGVQTRTSFPRVAYELTGIQYNADKQMLPSRTCPQASTTTGNIISQLNPVPYDISYNVYIAIKNIDDGLQIIEQILPNFRPSYNLTVKDIPELQIKKDIPIILGSVDFQDEYEGILDDARITIWTLSFVVKAYIYPPISDTEDNLIRTVINNMYNDAALEEKTGVHVTKVDPIDAQIDDDWDVDYHKYDVDDLDSNGDPIE